MAAKRTFSTTERGCLPDDRITLWRNTIQLFHQYNRPAFVGPFRKAGFRYRIEALMLTRSGEERTPDIVASSPEAWFALELTTNPSSKAPKLDSYKDIDPRYLSNHGLQVVDQFPDTMSSRLSEVDDGTHCQIIVKDLLRVRKGEFLQGERLRSALAEADGTDLSRLPSIPISLLPEMKTREIRKGLVDIAMGLFAPNTEGKSPVDIVDEGLERLAPILNPKDKRRLITIVERELKSLVRLMDGYLEYEDGIFRQTEKWKEHHTSREFIVAKLKQWTSRLTALEDFRQSAE